MNYIMYDITTRTPADSYLDDERIAETSRIENSSRYRVVNVNKAIQTAKKLCVECVTVTWQLKKQQTPSIMFLSVWTVISDIQDRQDGLARGIPWHEQDNVIENPLLLTTWHLLRDFFPFSATDIDIIDRYKGRAMEWIRLCLRLDKFAYSSWIFIRTKSSE